ncbi:hypothetical protein GGR52DRAFT_384301 [Hypoxylon sp. FL1284]|nr:hypothetical protein GGR52DRAFT_384301 [Hypoxylon sp. FL1284]
MILVLQGPLCICYPTLTIVARRIGHSWSEWKSANIFESLGQGHMCAFLSLSLFFFLICMSRDGEKSGIVFQVG